MSATKIKSTKTAKSPKGQKAPKPAKGAKVTTFDAGGGIKVAIVEKGASKAEKPSKKLSGLDAAFEVLKAKGEPMNCKDIVEEMLAKGIWKTGGKTPAATIYSAMLREIDGKPGESRFKKTGRGLFEAAGKKD